MAKWLRQRIANPSSPVRIRAAPLIFVSCTPFRWHIGSPGSVTSEPDPLRRGKGRGVFSVDQNPYSAPLADLPPDPDAVAIREIRSVVRVFRLIGWTSCLVCFLFFSMLATLIWRTLSFDDMIVGLVTSGVFVSAVSYLRTATALKAGRLSSKRAAILLSCLLLLGFPLFTLIGIICLQKVRRHFDDYCHLIAAAPVATKQ